MVNQLDRTSAQKTLNAQGVTCSAPRRLRGSVFRCDCTRAGHVTREEAKQIVRQYLEHDFDAHHITYFATKDVRNGNFAVLFMSAAL